MLGKIYRELKRLSWRSWKTLAVIPWDCNIDACQRGLRGSLFFDLVDVLNGHALWCEKNSLHSQRDWFIANLDETSFPARINKLARTPSLLPPPPPPQTLMEITITVLKGRWQMAKMNHNSRLCAPRPFRKTNIDAVEAWFAALIVSCPRFRYIPNWGFQALAAS